VESDCDQRSGGEELELHEAVDPRLVDGIRGQTAQPGERRIGERHGKDRDVPEPGAAEESDDGWDHEVELLFDGEAPERTDEAEQPSVPDDEEVSREEHEIGQGSGGERDLREERIKQISKSDGEKIERPDAKDAPKREESDVNLTRGFAFAEKKFGDEIGAENEEEKDSGAPHAEEQGQITVLRIVRVVTEEDEQKCGKAKYVELGTIESWPLQRIR
jgi:hypothetical protein